MSPIRILVDADACSVRDEVYRVAARKAGTTVLANNGMLFTTASIGSAIATRAIMADLRAGTEGMTGSPPPFAKADRSRFLQALDQALVRLER